MKTIQSKIIGVAILGLGTMLGNATFASSRMTKKLGLSVGFVSDPMPSILSYQLKYNVTPWLQVQGAYGNAGANVKSYGVSVKGFLLPNWNLSPFVGGGYTYAKLVGDLAVGGQTVSLTGNSMTVYYASAGIDHQSNMGFNFGGGINYALSPAVLTAKITLLPQFYVGWVF